MTVPATTQGRAAYYGDGATKEFVIPFLFYNNSDGTAGLRVSTSDLDGGNPTVLTYETDYTLTNEGAPAGTLTLAQPLPANRRIVVVYDLAFEQETSLSDFSRMPAQLIEKAMNRLTLELIQLREIVDRCVKEGVESTTDPNVVIEKINVLYSHIGELQTVAADIANIDAVSNDKTAIDALAAITGVLNTLNTNIEALITDAKNIAAINTVAGAEAELLALHGKLAELVAVYGKLPQVQTVSDAVNDVVLCAAEMAAVKDAPNQAAAAAASAQTAASCAAGAHIDANAAEVAAAAAAASQAAAGASESKAREYALQAVRRNVGDVFYTTRSDDALNGAVEADGAVYQCADFAGENAVPALLAAGKLPYISMAEYDNLLAEKSVNVFGWDGAGSAKFRVPLAENIEAQRAMVQIATGNTDNALVTAATVLPRMNRLEERFQIVSALPENPDAETFYFVVNQGG